MIQPSWSLWATWMGLVENPANFPVYCGSGSRTPRPLLIWLHKTHHLCLDQHTGWFLISSEAASSAHMKLFKKNPALELRQEQMQLRISQIHKSKVHG